MYCNVHHNLWPRLNLQSRYGSHIPLYKIDVTRKGIKDEFPQPFIFSLYLILFSWALFMQYFLNHMKGHCSIPLPPSLSEGQLGGSRDFLSLVDSCFRGPEIYLYWKMASCVYLVLLHSKLLARAEMDSASERGLLWFMWSLWRQAV